MFQQLTGSVNMITDFQMGFVQQNGQPRLGRLISTDTLAQVAAAGYVDNYIVNANADLQVSDAILVVASDGNAWFYLTFGVDHSVTLVQM